MILWIQVEVIKKKNLQLNIKTLTFIVTDNNFKVIFIS